MEPAALILLNEIMRELKSVQEAIASIPKAEERNHSSEDEGIITVEELKDYLGIGTTKAYEICNMKDFPCVRLGRRKVIPKKQLQEWLAKQAQEEKHYVRVIGR